MQLLLPLANKSTRYNRADLIVSFSQSAKPILFVSDFFQTGQIQLSGSALPHSSSGQARAYSLFILANYQMTIYHFLLVRKKEKKNKKSHEVSSNSCPSQKQKEKSDRAKVGFLRFTYLFLGFLLLLRFSTIVSFYSKQKKNNPKILFSPLFRIFFGFTLCSLLGSQNNFSIVFLFSYIFGGCCFRVRTSYLVKACPFSSSSLLKWIDGV